MEKSYRYSIPLHNYDTSIKLDINEYNFEHPQEFYVSLIQAIQKPKTLTHYSNMFCDEHIRLINNISKKVNLSKENVLITSGSDTALEYVGTCLFNNANSTLFYFVPNYSYMVDYLIKHKKNHIETIAFDILCDKYKLSTYLDNHTINDNDVIYISNPNNPTGLCVDKNDIELCLTKYSRINFVIDEAYIDFMGETYSMCSLVTTFPNLYIVRTFSKAYGIAGLRLGYILSQKQNITFIHNNALNEASLTEISKCAGNYILENLSYYNKIIQNTIDNREYFFVFLNEHNIFYIPSNANFVSIYIGNNCGHFTHKLQEKGIIVRNKTKDTNMYGFVRITIGTSEQMKLLCSSILEYGIDNIESKNSYHKKI